MSTLDTPISICSSKWPKGSEWRRWDLHVHTPESQIGSSFPKVTWNQYVTTLESAAQETKISVIGVTDYMSIDGYEKLTHEKKDNGKLSDVDLLVPNIEFRMMPPTNDGKALNLHLLVDPSEQDHIDRIKRALKNLKYKYKGQTYGCCRKELIEFAKAQRSNLTDESGAYRYGISQFKPDRTIIKEWLDNEDWLKKNSLIGIANGKDGICGLPLDGFAATRDEILSWCDFVFSGNPSDRNHYLGLKPSVPAAEIITHYGSLKPCIHGSDAHDITSLFKPAQDRFCWIKSDPSFHGLRQILWEPEDRIHVGMLPPQPSDKSQLIQNISISDTKGWFKTESLDLNPGLVAIIGEKGAGKTAIADLIAFASAVPIDSKSQSSFITKGTHYLSGMKVHLDWGGGKPTDAILTDTPYNSTRPRVRYLSQDFVERLCSSDHEGTELQKAIEDVVFAKLDEIQKEGYSSFGELRKAREAASNIRREGLRGELATLHKEVERLQNALAQREPKVQVKKEVDKQSEELQKQIPDASQSVDQEVLESLKDKQIIQKKIESEISSRTRRRRTIEDAVKSYLKIKKSTQQEIIEIQKQLSDVGIPDEVVKKLKPTWQVDADHLLNKEIEKIDAEVLKFKGKEDDKADTQSLLLVQSEIGKLKEKLATDEVSRKRLLDLQKQISEKVAMSERLAKEIHNLDSKVTKTLKKKQENQIELYLKVFDALNSDEEGLKELYSPMQKAIQEFGAEMQFSVSVGYQVDTKSWLSQANRLFDGRRAGAEEKRAEVERIVETTLVPAWKKGEISKIKTAFSEFCEAIDAVSFLANFGTSKLSLVELYDWMFSVDHITLTYKIRYSETELEYLSPGTRGIALLVLYLLMDEDDTRPLVIDQPEGNLDNSSVYKQLVPYIRRAKARRQIILITHNPNLVVATDAEQIIIATAERPSTQPYPCIQYHSGALEHSFTNKTLGIREAVCLLLEGGTEAFQVRENRYALNL